MADQILDAYASRAQASPYSEDDHPSALSDTIAAAFALQRREENFSSEFQNWGSKNGERAKVIESLGGDAPLARRYAYIPQSTTNRWRQAEIDGGLEKDPLWRAARPEQKRAYQQQRNFETRYPDKVANDQVLRDELQKELTQQRARDLSIIQRGSGIVAFTGAAGGAFTDPLVLMTLPFGLEAGAGKTVLGTMGRTALAEGAIGAATEVPLQAQVYAYKQEIQSPWTLRDSAMNVLAAGAGGAVLGGTIAGGIEGTKLFLKNYRESKAAGKIVPTPEMDAAEKILEEALPAMEANPLAEPDLTEQLHLDALDTARAQANDGQPVDVAGEVRHVEVHDPVAAVPGRSADASQLLDIDPLSLKTDARLFQYKAGGDAEGVTGALKDVQTFDRRLAGVALVWERVDGQRFIVDGHQRVGLARRAIAAGQDPAEVRLNGFLLREAEGVTAVDARRIAAAKNMAEGTGSPLDAAKILRDVGPAGEAALPPLPPRSALVRQARGLAALGEEEFLQVVNGVVEERFGSIVGSATAEPKLQAAMIQVLKRAQPANEVQARAIVDQVKTQGLETRTTEDLFGEQSFSESLYLERAQVLDEALRQMRSDKAVFGGLVANQERITAGAGNQLDRAGNLARQQEAADVATQISIRANAKGSLSDALQAAAAKLKAGASAASSARDFLKVARSEILQGARGGRGAGKTGRAGKAAGPAGVVEPTLGNPVHLAGEPESLRRAQLQAFKAKQAGRTVDELYEVAGAHQALLRSSADEMAREFGDDVQVMDPGVKTRAGTEEKITRKGYKDAGELTDVVRIGFVTRTPDQAARLVQLMAIRFEILDEGVSTTGLGYIDHKALVRFKDGTVGELQLWDEAVALAKMGDGHALYEQARVLTPQEAATPEGAAVMRNCEEASRNLYAAALAKATPEWRKVAMQALPEDMRARVLKAMEGGAPAPVKSVSPSQTDAFKQWFAGSKVVDETGAPLVVYHGTGETFEQFGDRFSFFVDDPKVAAEYGGEASPSIRPVYLNMQKPLEIDAGGRQWHELTLKDLPAEVQAKVESVPPGWTAKDFFEKYADRTVNPRDIARGGYLVGFDGLIVRNVRDGAGDYGVNTPATVYVTSHQDQVRSRLDPEFVGSGGASGKVSKNTARDSSRPDSSTSTGTTRTQASASEGTNQASSPPSGEGRSTAGRPSQLKNLSAIDAPPRSIIQRVDDPHSAHPEASRTGTVPDEDYEAVMAQLRGLQEDLGEQLKVARVVDGAVEDRSVAAVIDELDTLEESLERIRVCATPARAA